MLSITSYLLRMIFSLFLMIYSLRLWGRIGEAILDDWIRSFLVGLSVWPLVKLSPDPAFFMWIFYYKYSI